LSNGRYHVVISSAGGGYSRLARSGRSRAGARTPRAIAGDVCLSARSATGDFGPPRINPPCAHERLRSHLHAGARGVLATPCRSKSTPGSACRRRTTWSCVASRCTNRSPVARVIELTSYAEWCSRFPPRTRRIPLSAISSCKQNSRESLPPFSAPPGPFQEEKPPWLLHLMVVRAAKG